MLSFLNEKEIDQYKKIVALLIHGDLKKKAKIDKVSAFAIKGIRDLLPNATDDDVAKVMMAVSFILAHIQAAPLMDASNMIQEIFEEYMVSIAVLAGAYVPDADNVPDISTTAEMDEPAETNGGFTKSEWEDHLNKMYL